MAFIFTMHSQRRDMGPTGTLPAIDENGTDININPTNGAAAVPTSKKSAMGSGGIGAGARTAAIRPPWARNRMEQDDSPVSYFSMSDTSGSATDEDVEKRLAELRERPQIAKRGGWRRLALIAIIVVLCIVGLVVGLVVGLNKKNSCVSLRAS
jgi:hypothetical protein